MQAALPVVAARLLLRRYDSKPRNTAPWRVAMKSLLDLADSYEEWAESIECTAEVIMDCVAHFAIETQDHHRERASKLSAEAADLRARAAELRAPYIARNAAEPLKA